MTDKKVTKESEVMVKDTRTGQAPEVSRVDMLEDTGHNNVHTLSDEQIKAAKSRRSKRTSTDGTSMKLSVPEQFKNPKLRYEWMNGNPVSVFNKEESGWTVVSDPKLARLKSSSTDSTVVVPAGTITDGEKDELILMCIPLEFYNEDKLAQKKRIKELSDSIDGGKQMVGAGGSSTDIGGETYVPEGGIKIT